MPLKDISWSVEVNPESEYYQYQATSRMSISDDKKTVEFLQRDLPSGFRFTFTASLTNFADLTTEV